MLKWFSGKGEKGDPGIQGIQGNDGFSPEASVMPTATGARVTIKDKNGITTADINNGQNGSKGDNGFSPTATVTQTQTGATVSITDANGTTTAEIHNGTNGSNGNDGAKGADGVSPVATVSQLPNGAQISITDANGTTTATITNGTNGSDGAKGDDGFSPTASVTPTATGATVSITDKNGTTTANLTNGQDGAKGNDGVSPSATIQQTATGAVIEITDSVGTTSATISNGTNGAKGDPGVGIPSGGSDGQVLAKDGATDYATKWINPPSGGGGKVKVASAFNYSSDLYSDVELYNALDSLFEDGDVVLIDSGYLAVPATDAYCVCQQAQDPTTFPSSLNVTTQAGKQSVSSVNVVKGLYRINKYGTTIRFARIDNNTPKSYIFTWDGLTPTLNFDTLQITNNNGTVTVTMTLCDTMQTGRVSNKYGVAYVIDAYTYALVTTLNKSSGSSSLQFYTLGN